MYLSEPTLSVVNNKWTRALLYLTFTLFLLSMNVMVAAEQTNSDEAIKEERAAIKPLGKESQSRIVSPGIDSTSWLNAILGLMAVILLIFGIAWLVKRFTGLATGNQQQIRVLSAIPIGTRERIALIEVADKQLLVGITQHNINLLHSFDEPVVNKNDKTGADFASRLHAVLNKGASS